MVGIAVFVVLLPMIGLWLAGILSLVLLVLWYRFNISQGTVGLFRSNLRAYFSGRQAGKSKEETIDLMLSTRGTDRAKKMMALHSPNLQLIDFKEPDADVKRLVFAIFCAENGLPPSERLTEKFVSSLEEEYVRLSA